MGFTDSDSKLSTFLYEERSKNIPADSDPTAFERLQAACEADATAIVKWILEAGKDSLVATIKGEGNGQAATAGLVTAGTATAQTVSTPTATVNVSINTGTTEIVTSSLK